MDEIKTGNTIHRGYVGLVPGGVTYKSRKAPREFNCSVCGKIKKCRDVYEYEYKYTHYPFEILCDEHDELVSKIMCVFRNKKKNWTQSNPWSKWIEENEWILEEEL